MKWCERAESKDHRQLPTNKQQTYLNDSVGTDVLGRRSRKDEPVPLDMKVGESVGHEKDGRRVSGRRFLRVVVPELDLAKERLRVRALVRSPRVRAVLLRQDCVSAGRQDEERADHGPQAHALLLPALRDRVATTKGGGWSLCCWLLLGGLAAAQSLGAVERSRAHRVIDWSAC